jgi:exonuclease SbcC
VKPERLVLQAFGPFAGTQVLDFAELGRFGFFLIHGPTGSGKTTILDAMVFALYGDTSGGAATDKGARRADDMRSDHAPPELPTEVRFDFRVGERRYRVVRRPEQPRPRVRGEGSVVDKKTATLWERSGVDVAETESEGRPLATRWTDVTREVERIIGFRSVQFRQVVMLPQGRFQELLQAKSDEREEILQRLFRTERYLRLQQALKAEAQAGGRELEQLRERRAWLLAQAGVATADELAESLAAAHDEATAADEAVRAASAAETAALAPPARAAHPEARSVDARLDELDEARRLHDCLAAERRLVDESRLEAALAQKAGALAALDRAVHDRRNDLTPRLLGLELAENELERASAAREQAEAALAGELARQGERTAARERVRDLQAVLDRTQLVALARLARDEARARLDDAERAHEQAERVLSERRDGAAAAWRAAAERLGELEERWSRGQAAVLASSLRPGEPCPVCGSTDHPRPAAVAAEVPTEAEVVAGRGKAHALREAYDQARDEGDREIGARSRALADARVAFATAAALLAERERDVPEDLGDPEAVGAELEAARAESCALDEAWEAAQAADRESAALLAEVTNRHAVARSAHDQLAEVVAKLEAERLAAVSAAGFADEQAYLTARREPDDLAALQRRITEFDTESGGGGGGAPPGPPGPGGPGGGPMPIPMPRPGPWCGPR